MMNTERHGLRTGAGVLLACLTLASCASSPSVATDVNYCCSPGAAEIQTFRVAFVDTPEFLKPMLRDEASIVLGLKGIEYTETLGDATLIMRFVNRTFETVDEAQDEAWETIAPGGGVRFIAEVQLEMQDIVSGEVMWSGTMGRIHNVYEGSYMHDAPARTGMRDAFLALFADFPTRSSE